MKQLESITIEWPDNSISSTNVFSTIETNIEIEDEMTLSVEHIVALEIVKRLHNNGAIRKVNYEINGESLVLLKK